MIDQTYADELVPTPGVLAQAQNFDNLGQRYDLFVHTGADHLAFAVADVVAVKAPAVKLAANNAPNGRVKLVQLAEAGHVRR